MNAALIVIFLFTCEGVFRLMQSCHNQLPPFIVFVSACFIGKQENTQPPCKHYGNSSAAKNVRDIITRPMQTTLHLSPNDHAYNLMFENVNLPIHWITCENQQCALIIESMSLKIKVLIPSHSPDTHALSFRVSRLKVHVRTSVEIVNGRLSFVIRPASCRPSDDTRLSRCLRGATLLQDTQCSTLLFERALCDSSLNSCFIPTR